MAGMWGGWGRRTYHAVKSTNSAFCLFAINGFMSLGAINGVFALLATNALFSALSVNSLGSFASVNSFFSAFSLNCFVCLGCSGDSFCRGEAFGGATKLLTE
ncbi:hypothetical protein BU14_0386s0010 [Porphyra umbilicalis]|uniref:Uncharacterized protein n=1 Tax=Porphyra umbilicalis TaxID=2786 RepID=A0A1X6NWM2_PORUM|nr:hypothetical protein BU14_0386s0010 [Porphyra umbilicalis]|eukprot:OSX73011.1 hypothetical protein BU14_0386s0010 [Porphyra umbilicalis]